MLRASRDETQPDLFPAILAISRIADRVSSERETRVSSARSSKSFRHRRLVPADFIGRCKKSACAPICRREQGMPSDFLPAKTLEANSY
jgi:hypothetical protein